MKKKLKKKYLNKTLTILDCPKCGSNNVGQFLYGLPEFTEELKKQIEDGKVVLGGCEIMMDNPIFRCNDCKNEY